jgi:hypothetical protein
MSAVAVGALLHTLGAAAERNNRHAETGADHTLVYQLQTEGSPSSKANLNQRDVM